MIAPVSASVTTTTTVPAITTTTATILYPIPNADQQLQFLQRIQQLLTDANFTSTYKFALLLAIPIRLLAEKTIELY